MPRLFSGLALPDIVRQQLTLLRSPLPGAKWIEPENLHLTLRFAGDVEHNTAHDFAEALDRIQHPPFELALNGLGVFGGRSPTAIWAAIAPNPALADLARKHERAARQAGLPAETRRFTAHVTIARLRHSRDDRIARFLQHNGSFATQPFTVEAFVLFSARPRTGGGPYVIEHTFPLRHPAPKAPVTASTPLS